MRYSNFGAILLFASSLLANPEQEVKVNLKDPTFSQGMITTDQGGVITSGTMRIQAQKLAYTNKTENGLEVRRIEAEGDILLEYEGRYFVGEKLTYDFVSGRGVLTEGRTATDYWFMGGDTIELEPDGSFFITNAFITTSQGQDNWWELRSSRIGISENELLSAKNIKFRFFKIPLLWLPSFKANLSWIRDPPIRYKFIWDQVLKQKISMRYELYSTETFGLYGRFDYQFKYGPGAAIETDYLSLDKKTVFQTKNYGAYGKIVPQEHGNKRYRFQGLYTTHSDDEKTKLYLGYDKLSDDKMAQDFKSDDFEINTQKRTIFWVTHHSENYFGRFNFQPRINSFQSINQQLPFVTGGIRPFEIASSGVISDNWFSLGYLYYIFAKGLQSQLPSTRAGRLETNNSLYRPFRLGPATFTPEVGIVGIFYTNSPGSHSVGQGIFTYGADLRSSWTRSFTHINHTLTPYLDYKGYTNPTAPVNTHYIFNLDDGYAHLNLLRLGLRQELFSRRHFRFVPNLAINTYAYSFFGDTAFHRSIPKLYTQIELQNPSVAIYGGVCYNAQELLFDYSNIRSEWTVNEHCALGLDFRHRSKFSWRKADPENFVLEVERPIREMLRSPLSDGRDTLLTKLQLRLSPLWTCHVESHHGWGRRAQIGYNEFTLKLSTIISGNWQLELGVSYDPAKKWQSVTPTFKLAR